MVARNRVGIGLSYRPARLHRLAEIIPCGRFLGFINVLKYGLRTLTPTYRQERLWKKGGGGAIIADGEEVGWTKKEDDCKESVGLFQYKVFPLQDAVLLLNLVSFVSLKRALINCVQRMFIQKTLLLCSYYNFNFPRSCHLIKFLKHHYSTHNLRTIALQYYTCVG